MGTRKIPAGEKVPVLWASANRDEEFLRGIDTLEFAPNGLPERAVFPTGGFSYLPVVIGKR
jgi:cytochrome P450